MRVLQNGEIQRLGSDSARKVNVRLIAATNRPLHERVRDGAFRADLYHRLSVYPVHIPPLRERGERQPRGEARVQVTAESRRAHSPRGGAGGLEFLPVKVARPGKVETPRVEAEILLVGGRRVRVAGALTFEQLERLLQVVEGGDVC